MKIRTRLNVLSVASAAMIVIMALMLFWSQHRLATVTKASELADEIVSSLFERTMLRSDYLTNDNLRAKDQWLKKQSQIGDLIKKASSQFDSSVGKQTMSNMLKDNNESAIVFQQIVANRDSTRGGLRRQPIASEIESKLVGQLLLKTYDTIADARSLQEVSNGLIASTQRAVARVSFALVVSIAFFVTVGAWSLNRIISKGIEKLQQGAAAVGAGNLQNKITLTSDDEFGEVAGAFNSMSKKLAESHAALNQTVSQLQGANQELEAFAYSVSHDLRAPLRAMGGFSEALVEDFGDQLAGEARNYLNEIVIGSRHMAQLIDGLLTLSRSTRGELRQDRVDLSVMTERIRRELELTEPQRRVEWRFESELRVRGDERMIEVVMRNLLGNAWKYTTGVSEPIIRVYAEQEGQERYFCVADNGAGFDMAHAEKLFQPFQRLHRQDEFPGIGIGLATAQRIVHRHGGTISATGAPHKGAIFRFSLPFGEEYPREEL